MTNKDLRQSLVALAMEWEPFAILSFILIAQNPKGRITKSDALENIIL